MEEGMYVFIINVKPLCTIQFMSILKHFTTEEKNFLIVMVNVFGENNPSEANDNNINLFDYNYLQDILKTNELVEILKDCSESFNTNYLNVRDKLKVLALNNVI